MEDMDVQLLAHLNKLWKPIYPYLARWTGEWCQKERGWILELGPFSGGISDDLMTLFPHLRATCLVSQYEVATTIKKQFESNLEIAVGSLEALPFEASFNMAIFRGAFFFLTPEMIREAYRVLKPGACALVGGGYGPLTPPEEIAKIAEESKSLNDRLGKKWISKRGLEDMVKEAGMEGCSQIIEEGGLWLLLKKGLL